MLKRLFYLLIGALCLNLAAAKPAQYFPIKIKTTQCNPRFTRTCHGRHALVNFTGGIFSLQLQANHQGIIKIPTDMLGWRYNVDLLNSHSQQSLQNCFANSYLWPGMTLTLICQPR